MINIMVSKALAVVTNNETLTSGMIGARVQFTFSEDWDELSKMAVFKAGDVTKSVVQSEWSDGVCTIPHEVLFTPYEKLYIGVYGTDANNNIVVPTVWAFVGKVRNGVSSDAESSTEPTLPVWAQMQTQVNLKESLSNKVTSLSAESTDEQYPSAKAVYEAMDSLASLPVVIEGAISADNSEVTISTENAWQKVYDAWNDERHPLVMLRVDGEVIAYLSGLSSVDGPSGPLGLALFSTPSSYLLSSTPPHCIWLFEDGTSIFMSSLDTHMSDVSDGAVENRVIKAYVDEQVGNINALLETI